MSEITYSDYWAEVASTVTNLVTETYEWADKPEPDYYDHMAVMHEIWDDIMDRGLHETIDGHQWVIYYAYNASVIQHSNNPEYFLENFGADAFADQARDGLQALHMAVAFWAFYADCYEYMDQHWDEFIDLLDPEAVEA